MGFGRRPVTRQRSKAAGLILCGGTSTRMGRSKALLDWQGVPLLIHMVRLLENCGLWPLAVSAAADQELPAFSTDVLVFRDHSPCLGPMTGLVMGLTGLRPWAERAVVAACDMPLLQKNLVDLLLEQPGDAVVPQADGHWQPLLAVYATHLGNVARDLQLAGFNSPMQFLEAVQPVVVPEIHVRTVDSGMVSFLNCNTPENYVEALARYKALKSDATVSY